MLRMRFSKYHFMGMPKAFCQLQASYGGHINIRENLLHNILNTDFTQCVNGIGKGFIDLSFGISAAKSSKILIAVSSSSMKCRIRG